MKVFLGGTCNNSTWRDELIPMLRENELNYFNPVVEDWNEEAKAREDIEKTTHCNVHLYFITSKMTGVYSIAEIIDSAHTEDKDTIFVLDPAGFDKGQLKSLKAVGSMVEALGAAFIIYNQDYKSIIDMLCFLKEDDEL